MVVLSGLCAVGCREVGITVAKEYASCMAQVAITGAVTVRILLMKAVLRVCTFEVEFLGSSQNNGKRRSILKHFRDIFTEGSQLESIENTSKWLAVTVRQT